MDPAHFVNAIPLPNLIIEASGRITAASTDAMAVLGQGLAGRNYVTMLRQPALLRTIEDCFKGGLEKTGEYHGHDGAHDTTYRVSVRPIGAAARIPVAHVLVCFEDITHLRQVGQMRRDFVANVSHELRTPLTALMGFIETLRGPARDDANARARFLDIMEAEASRMNRLVGDLLSLSRVESQQRVRPTERLKLTDVLSSTLTSLRPVADEAEVTLFPEFSEMDLSMTADLDQIRQVFTNLIENGIKYGASGGRVAVRLAYSQHDPVLRSPSVRVQVIDDGPGIDASHLPRLTERFYRADTHRSRQLGGTGLGLAIVKHIVNRHRGRLRVESELGSGSTFTVILPCDALTANPKPDESA